MYIRWFGMYHHKKHYKPYRLASPSTWPRQNNPGQVCWKTHLTFRTYWHRWGHHFYVACGWGTSIILHRSLQCFSEAGLPLRWFCRMSFSVMKAPSCASFTWYQEYIILLYNYIIYSNESTCRGTMDHHVFWGLTHLTANWLVGWTSGSLLGSTMNLKSIPPNTTALHIRIAINEFGAATNC